jgi:hypothetical protein
MQGHYEPAWSRILLLAGGAALLYSLSALAAHTLLNCLEVRDLKLFPHQSGGLVCVLKEEDMVTTSVLFSDTLSPAMSEL